MTTKQTYIAALFFSFIPGIINILGLKLFGVVLTNVTGHYSGLVQQINVATWHDAFRILSYITIYWLGSVFSSTCFIIGNKKGNPIVKAIPTLVNLCIMLLTINIGSIPITMFFLATSIQNSFGANHSKNEIRPSQITGVVMASGLDFAKYFFSDATKAIKKTIMSSFITKTLNILGFVLGGITAYYFTTVSILWIPVIFYFVISYLIIKQKL
jgi:hypothetical protein